MPEMSSYLKRLEWDPCLAQGGIAGLLTNFRITVLIIITILIGGIFGLLNLPRRINPQVEIPIVFISTVFPGASPQDVEKLVTKPLEDSIQGVQGIERLSSTSVENVSSIVVEFNSHIDRDKAKSDVQAAVDSIGSLPQDIRKPSVVALDFEDIPVVTFSILGSTNEASLMQFARSLKEEIEDLPEVQKVVVSGLERSEIEVQLNPESLNRYKLNPTLIQQSVRTALSSFPAGSIASNGLNLSIAIDGQDNPLQTLRSLPLESNGTSYVLGDIASISIRSAPRQPKSFYATNSSAPTRSVTFSVFKTLDADLEKSASVVKNRTRERIEASGNQYQMVVTTDFEKSIKEQFGDLLGDFSQSIFLVFLTLLIFLGLRQATIASLVIPLSFFATFGAMYLFDIQLSFLSLFSLLLGLGMIVDDTIVMISAMTDYYATRKFTPSQTGLLVWKDYLTPTLTSNLTNVWSFLPLLIAAGIMGEFTKVISIVVTLALIGSTAIALVITIPLMIVILKPSVPKRVIYLGLGILFVISISLILFILRGSPLIPVVLPSYFLFAAIAVFTRTDVFGGLQTLLNRTAIKGASSHNLRQKLSSGWFNAKKPIAYYKKVLIKVLESKKAKRQALVAVVILSVVSYLLVPLGLVKNEFFPNTDQDTFYMTVELPIGTKLAETQVEANRLLEELRRVKDIEYVLMDIGVDVNVSSTSLEGQDLHLIRYSLKLLEDRDRPSMEVAQSLRDTYEKYPKGTIRVAELSDGPPSGSDLQLTVLGDDLDMLQTYAEQLSLYLNKQAGVTNVRKSINPGLSKLVFTPDKNKFLDAGISLDQAGFTTRLFTSGMELDRVALDTPECADECPIMLRLSRDQLTTEELSSIVLTSRQGSTVPLLTLGNMSLSPNPTQVTRLDGKRSITVTAAVLPGFNRVDLGLQLERFASSDLGLISGYSWQTGGMNEENQKSVNSVLQSMVIAAILIMGTMVVELRSFRKAFIVMLVIPLAIAGVFYVFALTGTPLSFPALIGVLALFGIVVKNSILIVDKINRNLEIGLPFTEAVADGSSSRLEPIVFSSVTNIIGLIPITISDPLWRGLGGAIISGLTLSGLIMLIFIPVVFDSWYRPEYEKRIS